MFEIDIPDFNMDFDLSFFKLMNGKDELDNRYSKPKVYKQLTEKQLKFSNAQKLAEATRIEKDEKIDVIVSGDFIFGDFIEAYFVLNQVHTERLVISTLSMNQNNVDSLKTLMLKGYVDNLDLIISNFFFSHERNKLIPYIYEELDYENKFQLAVVRSHTKTLLAKTDGGKHLVINGSANLRSSNNIETFTIEDNKETYDFHLDYQNRIIEHYQTIDKAVGAKKLWQTIKG